MNHTNLNNNKGTHPQNVQIPWDLWMKLLQYHFCDAVDVQDDIVQGLSDKLDALARRELYTTYKTAETPQERNKARMAYLTEIGVPEAWRWD